MMFIISEAAGAMAGRMVYNGLGAHAAAQKAIEMEIEAGRLLVAPEKPVVVAAPVVEVSAVTETEPEAEMTDMHMGDTIWDDDVGENNS